MLVVADITYALLLGAELADVLVYILVFALIGVTALLPTYKRDERKEEPDKEPNAQIDTKDIDGEQSSEGEEEL